MNKRQPITLDDVRRVTTWSKLLQAETHIKKAHKRLDNIEQTDIVDFDTMIDVKKARTELNFLWQDIKNLSVKL